MTKLGVLCAATATRIMGPNFLFGCNKLRIQWTSSSAFLLNTQMMRRMNTGSSSRIVLSLILPVMQWLPFLIFLRANNQSSFWPIRSPDATPSDLPMRIF
jgi:hypothetical protein